MNIFILDNDISKCALYHCDRHVVKMILESAQMLSTVVRGSGVDSGYKITHLKHPCTLWVGDSLSNWKWLCELATALNQEYKFRFGKKINHKSYDLIQSLPSPKIPDRGLTSFAQAMPEKYKNRIPVVAYRNYYLGEKSHLFSWTKRAKPPWIKDLPSLT
jgi:hypothetical protein